MKMRLHFSINKTKRILLLLFALVFTTVDLGAQAYAVDKQFFAGNDILFYDPTCTYAGGDGSLVGNSNAEKIWNFLVGKGLSDEQAAGVMGNMHQESNFKPDADQNGPGGNDGYGIVQWTGGRRTALENAAKKKGVEVSDLKFQLDYLYQESNARPVTAHGFGDAGSEWNTLKIQKTIEDATVFWHNNFEVSADSPEKVIKARGGFAKDAYNSFAGKSASGSSDTSAAKKPVVYLDPGHGGAISQYTDPKSGLVTSESHNMPESADALDVANMVKKQLESDGYQVEMSRTSNDQKVKFRDRSDAAEKAKADIGVSIHTTPGEVNQAWPQRVGTYRQYGSHKDTFTNKATAQKSEAYATAFARTRSAAEGHTVTTDPGNTQEAASFGRDGIASKGNIPLIALWAPDVPWVYNEIAQDKGTAISDSRKQAYAKGIIDGIEQSVPSSNKDECGNSTFNGGDLQQTILAYAWPDYHPADYTNKKPEYAAAVKKAVSQGRYVGGGQYPGVDCGGFVTTLMVDSGFEPKYNSSGKGGNTTAQEAWASKNWKKLGSNMNAADLKPGDVAFMPGHTFVYAGDIPGFHSPTKVASASFEIWRAPMAGHEGVTGGGVTWYRKK